MPQAQSRWQKRVRRLLMLAGTASTVYFVLSYVLGRMRDARIRALRERRERDLIKSHFTSLLSTISFTLYALLPTLYPQVFDAYPVEQTSSALQSFSAHTTAPGHVSGTSDLASSDQTPESTPSNSILLETQGTAGHAGSAPEVNGASHLHPGDSWASEFRSRLGSEASTSIIGQEDDIFTTSSALSQSISLPPTDISSDVPSPPSDLSQSILEPSPTRAPQQIHVVDPRSKKELWRDLKVQSITRALTTVYLLPLLYLLTSSQLAVLARTRYLADIKEALELKAEVEREAERIDKSKSWLGYFSVDAMGLGEYVERGVAAIPSPLAALPAPVAALPTAVYGWIWGERSAEVAVEPAEALAAREAELRIEREEAEKLFLTYSWWLLHEGWRGIAQRVESAVDRIFGGMALKRDLSVEDWEQLVKEVRASVETELDDDGTVRLYNFSPHLVPPAPLPPTYDACPLPLEPSHQSAYLVSLLAQTSEHVRSRDGRHLIDRGVSAMVTALIDRLRAEIYELDEPRLSSRLVGCLPELNRWGKSVWEGIPDAGVEALLGLPEFEAFTALIFGDWAPR